MANGTSEDGSSEDAPGDHYRVILSVPWIVRWAPGAQDAINIAVSEVGKRVENANTERVVDCQISVQQLSDGKSGQTNDAVLLVGETALVGLLLTCDVVASSPEESKRFARRELGREFEEVPLVPTEVSPLKDGTSDR